jgi:hypothetical protein
LDCGRAREQANALFGGARKLIMGMEKREHDTEMMSKYW